MKEINKKENEPKRGNEGLEILRAGINRFYSEGMIEWKLKDVLIHVGKSGLHMDEPLVEQTFKEWEKMGVIEIVGKEDCFFRVLRPFPHQDAEIK